MKALTVLALLALGGCAAIDDLVCEQRVYGGTRSILPELDEPARLGPCFSPGWLSAFDLPCSFALDTLFLPFTVILAIVSP